MTALTPITKTARAETPVHRWRAFAVLAVAYFMTIVDLTIVNVALPTIGRKLHFSETNLQWVVTAYALTFGGFLLLGGRAADLLGRRRIVMLGLGVFTATSLACALATTDSFLIAMRGLQGLGAAIVLPAALSIVMNMFDEGGERNKALGIWGGIGAGGATVGLIAGGVLTRYLGWQYIRSEEHTSELQSQSNLVCRLLLEKKKTVTRREMPLTGVCQYCLLENRGATRCSLSPRRGRSKVIHPDDVPRSRLTLVRPAASIHV